MWVLLQKMNEWQKNTYCQNSRTEELMSNYTKRILITNSNYLWGLFGDGETGVKSAILEELRSNK